MGYVYNAVDSKAIRIANPKSKTEMINERLNTRLTLASKPWEIGSSLLALVFIIYAMVPCIGIQTVSDLLDLLKEQEWRVSVMEKV